MIRMFVIIAGVKGALNPSTDFRKMVWPRRSRVCKKERRVQCRDIVVRNVPKHRCYFPCESVNPSLGGRTRAEREFGFEHALRAGAGSVARSEPPTLREKRAKDGAPILRIMPTEGWATRHMSCGLVSTSDRLSLSLCSTDKDSRPAFLKLSALIPNACSQRGFHPCGTGLPPVRVIVGRDS